jgi:hypothetical protein
MWHDQLRLIADLPAGSSSVTLSDVASNYDFQIGNNLLLYSSPLVVEGIQITAISGALVTFNKPTENDWPAGTFVYPVRSALLQADQTVTRQTAKLSQATVSFRITQNPVLTAVASTTTYNGLELFLMPPDRSADVTAEYQRVVDTLDYNTGGFREHDPSGRPYTVRSWQYLLQGRANILAFKEWLYQRQGRLTPFYMPTWENNLTLTEIVGATSSLLAVQNSGMSSLLSGVGSKTDCLFLLSN